MPRGPCPCCFSLCMAKYFPRVQCHKRGQGTFHPSFPPVDSAQVISPSVTFSYGTDMKSYHWTHVTRGHVMSIWNTLYDGSCQKVALAHTTFHAFIINASMFLNLASECRERALQVWVTSRWDRRCPRSTCGPGQGAGVWCQMWLQKSQCSSFPHRDMQFLGS